MTRHSLKTLRELCEEFARLRADVYRCLTKKDVAFMVAALPDLLAVVEAAMRPGSATPGQCRVCGVVQDLDEACPLARFEP